MPHRPQLQLDPEAFDLNQVRAHFVGIGGCGMSGLARMFRGRGATVTGSDQTATAVTEALQHEGFPVECADPGSLPGDAQLVVASAAIRPEHPQLVEAKRRSLPVLTYAQAIGRCMIGRTAVAVAGTHGKSSTVAALGHTLIQAGLDPTVIVGATCRQLATDPDALPSGFHLGAPTIPIGARAGAPGLLLAEACEFNRSFLNHHPTVGAVTNVEADHLDIYGDLAGVIEAFNNFARLLPPEDEGGVLLIAHDGAHRTEVAAGVRAKVETIGFSPEADWRVEFDPETAHVALIKGGVAAAQWINPTPGVHSAMNSAFACALAITVGADPARAAAALASFQGVDRRLQFLGEVGGVRVYDDYGHHPTEIDATLRALRQHERPTGRLVCVFQPHQHSRTRFLLDEFAQSFTSADAVIVPHIYFVRDTEEEKTLVGADDLVRKLTDRGVEAQHIDAFDDIVEHLHQWCAPGDLLVVMGAGPVWKVAHQFVDRQGAASSVRAYAS